MVAGNRMGVVLQPLEFSECLTDSPAFRENLQRHEKELDRTSQHIKRLIREIKDVVNAAKRLSAAQLALAASMEQLQLGGAPPSEDGAEDASVMASALQHLALLMRNIEEERDRMLCRAQDQVIEPLERFRKEHIGAVKESRKKFEKKSAKFSQSQERTLALSLKKQESIFQEADAALDMAQRDVWLASLEYVWRVRGAEGRRAFDLLEPLLSFAFGWWTFHHAAHDLRAGAEPRVRDLQLRVQRARDSFAHAHEHTHQLLEKMTDLRQTSKEEECGDAGGCARAGYLFLMEKKAFGTTWSKHWAQYEPSSRVLSLSGAGGAGGTEGVAGTEGVEGVATCVAGARLPAEPPDRRFCWEALPADRERAPLMLQALSDADRAAWLRAIDGGDDAPPADSDAAFALDARGFALVTLVTRELEARGLQEQGLYRVGGVASRAARLAAKPPPAAALADAARWESRTLTSALKHYLRSLPDPLLTARLYPHFVAAARERDAEARVAGVRALVGALPAANRRMLRLLCAHLRRVAAHAPANRMGAANLAVCLGPTLLRAPTPHAAVLDVKHCNLVVETLIDHFHEVFDDDDECSGAEAGEARWAAPFSRARTLYACVGDAEGELSFEPNQIITGVAWSGEPGWLRAALHGRVGLVPENYVEPLP